MKPGDDLGPSLSSSTIGTLFTSTTSDMSFGRHPPRIHCRGSGKFGEPSRNYWRPGTVNVGPVLPPVIQPTGFLAQIFMPAFGFGRRE